ncbi:hypothetical protein EWB00_010124 [Schistosoma japonicum]|uniref:Uncharacterized protein n=1 Tax=Schistosoma japonicum TaxID=6182 RepID=A0A4Z2CL08_SCHJA|nr:hypothetical protein EWB00_010124 [Schistosoma japonicum]
MVSHRQRHRSHHQHHSHHRHSSKHQQKCYCSNSPPTLETTSSVSHSPASSSSLTTTISTGNELHMNTVNVADRHHNHNNNKMSTIKPELHSVKVEHEQETTGDEIVSSVTMATSGGDGHGENMTKCSSHNQ